MLKRTKVTDSPHGDDSKIFNKKPERPCKTFWSETYAMMLTE